MARILIIDDEDYIRDILSARIEQLGHEALTAATLEQGLRLIEQQPLDLIFLDVHLPDGNGLDALPAIRQNTAQPEIIIITAAGSARGAELAISQGAWDYIEKPFYKETLILQVQQALEYRKAKQKQGQKLLLETGRIIGKSRAVFSCFQQLAQCAGSMVNVLIQGESGTGKAVIHDSLYMTVKEYQQKYRGRKTWIDVGYSQIDLFEYFQNNSTRAAVSYRIFWQRLKRLIKSYAVDEPLLEDALTFSSSDWISFYGGGRHRSFYYGGDLFPDYFGKKFHGFSAFLKTVGRYADKDVVWSRLKAGWNIDSALSEPVAVGTERTGRIYQITRLKTGQIYVGLTRSTIEQRWSFHVRNALNGAKTKLSKAIRKDSPSGFSIEIIEDDIRESTTLSGATATMNSRLMCSLHCGKNFD